MRGVMSLATSAGEEVGMKPGVRLKHLALGQGMGPRALELITAGVSRGIWVLLQNCHLLPKFMPLLEKALDKLERPHKVCHHVFP